MSFEVSLNYKKLSDSSQRKTQLQKEVQLHNQKMNILFVVIKNNKFNNNFKVTNYEHITISILFYIKRAKVNSLGVCPIYIRVTVNAKRFEFSANRFINPDRWSSKGIKAKGSSE